MSRQKQKKPILHKPATQDIFISMTDCPNWLELLRNEENKGYHEFLSKLFEKGLYRGFNERVAITKIAKELRYPPAKVTKWIAEIYSDVFALNEEKPELFKQEGVRHELYFSNYDNRAALTVWLTTTPRTQERFSFYFMHAKMGCDAFYVAEINHHLEKSEHTVQIFLKGGFPNEYRSYVLDKALFLNQISFYDIYMKHDFQIDEELKSLYKSLH